MGRLIYLGCISRCFDGFDVLRGFLWLTFLDLGLGVLFVVCSWLNCKFDDCRFGFWLGD